MVYPALNRRVRLMVVGWFKAGFCSRRLSSNDESFILVKSCLCSDHMQRSASESCGKNGLSLSGSSNSAAFQFFTPKTKPSAPNAHNRHPPAPLERAYRTAGKVPVGLTVSLCERKTKTCDALEISCMMKYLWILDQCGCVEILSAK